MTRVRVLQVSDSLAIEYGGTAAACAQLSNHLVERGIDVSLLTAQPANGGAQWPLDNRVRSRYCRRRGPIAIGWRLGPLTDTPAIVGSLLPLDVIHIHGLWRMPYLQAARAASARGVALIVSAHGMLHAQALSTRSLSKRVARWLFQDALLLEASRCLHATAPQEADELRRAGYRGPIAVIPWGVDLPAERRMQNGAPASVLLYLGRLHPSKGLDALLAAWAQVCGSFPTWRLALAGSDEDGHRARLEQRARDLGITDSVTFTGPVSGDSREALFAAAAIVVLPSPAENFGLVIPEALARGIPVIATTGAPWPALISERCGWWPDPGASALARTLREALACDAPTRADMGERGRRYALARYTWDRVAASMNELYEWAAGRAAAPAFLIN